MTCLACKKAAMVRGSATLPTKVKGESFSVFMSGILICKCGATALPGNRTAEFMRLGADEYRKKHGLLTSVEIRYRRDKLGISQEAFATHLGVGVASIKRWEMGQVQDVAMDKLIRLRTSIEEATANAAELRSLLHQPAISRGSILAVREVEQPGVAGILAEKPIPYYASDKHKWVQPKADKGETTGTIC